jgi:hypothetical protein
MPQIPSGFGQNRGILFFAEDNPPARPQVSFSLWRQAMNRGSTAAPLLSQQYFDALTGELQQCQIGLRTTPRHEVHMQVL